MMTKNTQKCCGLSVLYIVNCKLLFLCSDESISKPNETLFWCSNNMFISRDCVCDLHKDCPEGEDEEQDCGECGVTIIASNFHSQY